LEISTCPSEKYKGRRTEVGYPTREKKSNVRSCWIEWIECERSVVNKITRMIQHHDDHHNATQQIYGVNT
jgi:hypothetical protein